jgi:hypothetical protein
MESLQRVVQNTLSRLPVLRDMVEERRRLSEQNRHLANELAKYETWVPPGHFYSPIPSIQEIKAKEEQVFGQRPRTLSGIDLNEAEQLEFLDQFAGYYKDLPFMREKQSGLRYFFENPNYSYSDAIVYYCMLRHARPRRIVEIGSGYSSCLALDTNERFFGNRIDCTFIEPYPELLRSLIKGDDAQRIHIRESNLQSIALEEFSRLASGDILFIDSTHVSRIGSDVNYIIFEILPALNAGVLIHFHDVFFPFEYPKEWIYEGRAWNEIYILRAFLQYNHYFKIIFFNTFLETFYKSRFAEKMPLCLENLGGSLWLRKEHGASIPT